MKKRQKIDIEQLFARWQDDRLSEKETLDLEALLKDDESRKSWESLKEAWQALERIEVPFGTETEVQWQHLRNRISAKASNKKLQSIAPKPSFVSNLLGQLTAPRATLIAGLAAVVLMFYVKFANTDLNEIVVPYGKQMQVELSDGSIVYLNSGSTFHYPTNFDSNSRTVALKGEGYFVVVPGSVPFNVNTDRATTRVLGTEFNVRTWDAATEVFVRSGKVSVNSQLAVQASEVLVLPGQLAVCADASVVVHSVNAPGTLPSWRQGALEFQNRPLHSILAELRRTYNAEVSAEESLLSHKLSASFKNESLAEIVSVLAATLNASIEMTVNGFKLSANK